MWGISGPPSQSGRVARRRTEELDHGVILVATGARVHQPDQYLFGRHPKVILQTELERRLGELGEGGAEGLRDVLMIQCVGSRDESHSYCSSVCCSHAVKNALKLKELNRDIRVTVLYRDMMTYGLHEDYYTLARERGIRFIRYERAKPPVVEVHNAALRVTIHDTLMKEPLIAEPDLVVLSPAIEPYNDPKLNDCLRFAPVIRRFLSGIPHAAQAGRVLC